MARKAPVCHIPPTKPATDAQAPVDTVYVPQATDLASTMAAVNALRLVYLRGTGGFGGAGHGGTASSLGPGGTGGTVKDEKKKQGQWVETNRQTEKVKVTNPDDPSQFIELERINQLTFKDAATGETWFWQRKK
jgi:hypothetical protein